MFQRIAAWCLSLVRRPVHPGARQPATRASSTKPNSRRMRSGETSRLVYQSPLRDRRSQERGTSISRVTTASRRSPCRRTVCSAAHAVLPARGRRRCRSLQGESVAGQTNRNGSCRTLFCYGGRRHSFKAAHQPERLPSTPCGVAAGWPSTPCAAPPGRKRPRRERAARCPSRATATGTRAAPSPCSG